MFSNVPKTVLVIEDNQTMNEAICDILEMHDLRALSASDGQEGLALMRTQRPDLVLCDIMMPQMDGYELLRRVRSDEQLRTVPFVFLTARSSQQDHRDAKVIGIDDFLIKPVTADDLMLAISNVLRREEFARAQMEQQMERLRNNIVTALQHEFRTPLTFILGYAELIAEGASEEIDVETLRLSTAAILEGGHRLQKMIENFLLLADVQYRQQLPETAAVDVAHLLETLAGEFRPQAEDAGLSFVVRCPMEQPIAMAEADYLQVAFRKLIENAIQYRLPHSSRIELSVTRQDGYLKIQIIDDGRGIPEEELKRLRTPFAQIDRENRAHPGAGLGLALAQQIVHLHGGDMDIESTVNQGSTFTIWLPHADTQYAER